MAEYGLLLAVMAVAMIVAIATMSNSLFATFLEADAEVHEIMVEGGGLAE